MHLFNPLKTDIEATYLQYGDMLYRLALARLCNDADAEDAVQDVFTKYISSKPDFKDENHKKAWFLRSMINQCHDIARRQKIRIYTPLDEALDVADEEKSILSDLFELIAQLPDKYADVVVLHSLEGFSIDEISQLLDISPSAVKMRLSRAREMLQKSRKE